ncbi:hypothetical protein CMT87_09000 [Elizabethkingia anophelis]|nr:ISL3 family transposase [Elizabethkingia anophelis]MYY49932.1 ISL3 family transposase [Elizabethkingia anophelis]PRQ84640.1 hypothetical protein CMT87_09000 [Elizabethkingia anophelis]PRQ85856.1 hypothetical protein CMT86_14295 [Elizabethkingia anophelis]
MNGVTAIGVDDWAYKKRDSYGSILVNLHTGKVIDLLPDREEYTLRKWLEIRPEIKVMTRDRYSNYQKAITSGAPQAIQVTDRWHLLKNLSETVQKVLVRQYNKVNATLAEMKLKNEVEKPICDQDMPYKSTGSESTQGGVRLQRFKQFQELQGKGYSIRAMARHLGMSRQTIRRYMDMETLPRRSNNWINPLERFFPYIKKRMEKEPDILLTTLWEGLKSEGYNGAYTTLSDALKYYGIRVGKKARLTRKLPTRAGAPFKPSTAAIWFVSDQTKLNKTSRKIVNELCMTTNEIKESFTLAQSFRNMMVMHSGSRELNDWVERSTSSGIKEIATFAKGILADYMAVENALTLPWSNGPVEGNVNRLKTIKRQMYGRAGFDLLRRRVVYSPS